MFCSFGTGRLNRGKKKHLASDANSHILFEVFKRPTQKLIGRNNFKTG
jgi:hypothetical protein